MLMTLAPTRRRCATASTAAAAFLIAPTAIADTGIQAVQSPHSVSDTLDRFETIAKSKGLKIFARIDHAAGAASIGADLRPTALVIFGNPKGGTPIMQCAQSFAIDLPLKALAWQDADGQVWLGTNDLQALASRHGAEDCAAVEKVNAAAANLIKAAVAP